MRLSSKFISPPTAAAVTNDIGFLTKALATLDENLPAFSLALILMMTRDASGTLLNKSRITLPLMVCPEK
jgi:hypothetical protein